MRDINEYTILIVDDIRTNAELLIKVLSGDYQFGVAIDGESALAYVESNIPDLILLDIDMPGMDGYEVCRRLKSESRTQDIPVIFISGMDESTNKTAGFELGAVDYITKPFDINEVKARIKTHLTLQHATRALEDKNIILESLSKKISKYISPQIYESIFSGRRDVKIETYRKKLTIFFSDIVGFTQHADSMESEDLAFILNDYLNEMSKIALGHGGTIDKFIGDAIMIFFGDPETRGTKDDALACVNMALQMREEMVYLRRRWDEAGISKPLHIRIGINTGFCTVGNFGSDDRLDYTIIGGQVNLASRLESQSEPDQILISQETYTLIRDDISCEKKDEIIVKGIAYPVQTYQVAGLIERMNERDRRVTGEGPGYSFAFDFSRVLDADKNAIVESMKKAMSQLEK